MYCKKKWISVLLACLVVIMLVGCGNNSNKESNDETKGKTQKNEAVKVSKNTAKKATATPKTTATPVPTASTEPLKDLASYDTKNIPFGVGRNVDPKTNRPTGATYYQDKYGHLDADFIMSEGKNVYLTFDEGYENGYTGKILDTLKEKNVKAVFFVTLPYVKSQPELIKRMIDEGHIVGNHSVHHPSKGMASLSIEKQKEELTGLQDYMTEHYHYKMDLFRFPTGAFSEQSLAIVKSLGYHSVFWSFGYQDWITNNQPAPSVALKTMMERLHGGAIYLLHAVSKTNTAVLGDFIDQVRDKGYTFTTFPDPNAK